MQGYRKRVRRLPRTITDDEFNKILDFIDNDDTYIKSDLGDFLRSRDKYVLKLLWYTGLRPGEALCLKWQDIDFEKALIYVKEYFNKERNDTPAVMNEQSIQLLKTYKCICEATHIKTDFLFPSIWTWKNISEKAFARRFRYIVKSIGIAKMRFIDEKGCNRYSINLYSFRHTFLTKVYKTFQDLKAVQELARHTRPESSFLYIHLDNEWKKGLADGLFR